MRLDQFRLNHSDTLFEKYLKLIMEERNCTREEAYAFHNEGLKELQQLEKEGHTYKEAYEIRNKRDPLRKKIADRSGNGWQFTFETNGINFLFQRLLGRGFKNEDTRTIRMNLVEEIADEEVITTFNGFTDVQLEFYQDKFLALSDYEKKKETLELIMSGIRKVATYKGWDMRLFEEVCEKIIELDYKNEEWKDKKIAIHPSKKLKARVFVQHEVQSIEIFIVVTDSRKKELYREKIITKTLDVSHSYAVVISLNDYDIAWKNENQVILTSLINYDGHDISEWVVRVPYNVISGAKPL